MPKILLHICCAPDATVAVERLRERFDITGFFYNPNIEPLTEYALRAAETRLLSALQGFTYREEESRRDEWAGLCSPFAAEPERGQRCRVCISHRLQVTAQRAVELGHTHFTTTLTTSPHKDVDFIHDTGGMLAREYGLIYLPESFRSRDGYRRSLELCREYDLYRQNYCGCRWSDRNGQRVLPKEPEILHKRP